MFSTGTHSHAGDIALARAKHAVVTARQTSAAVVGAACLPTKWPVSSPEVYTLL